MGQTSSTIEDEGRNPYYKEHIRYKARSYDDVDPDDYDAVYKTRKSILREQWVKSMETHIIARQLSKCYWTEEVNAPEHCKDLAQMYVYMLKDSKVKGYLFKERYRNDLQEMAERAGVEWKPEELSEFDKEARRKLGIK